MAMHPRPFHVVYRDLLGELLDGGYEERNLRTGVRIKALPGGCSFKLDLRDGVPIAGNRRYFPHLAAAEVAWQFLGTQDPDFILRHAPKLWSSFVEEGKLKAAYGYRWREHFGRDQLALAVSALAHDPTSRQVYVSAWDPAADGLGTPGQPKNIPCPVGFSLTVVGDELHCSVFIRSSDVFVGLPYDIMAYAMTTDAVAARLGRRPGTLHVTLAHPHLYEPHFKYAHLSVHGQYSKEWCTDSMPHLAVPYDEVARDPEQYVERARILAKRLNRPLWNPLPAVVE